MILPNCELMQVFWAQLREAGLSYDAFSTYNSFNLGCIYLGVTLSIVSWAASVLSVILSNHERGKKSRNSHCHWGIVLQHPTLPPLCPPKSDLSPEASSCRGNAWICVLALLLPNLCLCTHHLTSLNISFLFYKMKIIIKTEPTS